MTWLVGWSEWSVAEDHCGKLVACGHTNATDIWGHISQGQRLLAFVIKFPNERRANIASLFTSIHITSSGVSKKKNWRFRESRGSRALNLDKTDFHRTKKNFFFYLLRISNRNNDLIGYNLTERYFSTAFDYNVLGTNYYFSQFSKKKKERCAWNAYLKHLNNGFLRHQSRSIVSLDSVCCCVSPRILSKSSGMRR